MMNLADQKELSELVLKAGPNGKTFLGPPGDAGTADDRIVSNVDPNSFTTDLGRSRQRKSLWHDRSTSGAESAQHRPMRETLFNFQSTERA